MALLAVALLYALSGHLSVLLALTCGRPLSLGWHDAMGLDNCLFPLPFALLSTMLLLRSWKALICVPLNVLIWFLALRIVTLETAQPRPSLFFIRLFAAGLVGALGVAVADSICQPGLRRLKRLWIVALIGAASAWLGFYLGSYYWLVMGVATAWQVAVGTYLYFACSGRETEEAPADSQDATRLGGA